MHIKIVAVGKIKEKYIRDGIQEFSKRISRYAKLQIVEVNYEKAPESLSKKDMENIKIREGRKILSKLPSRSYVVALEIKGKQINSEELSERIENLMIDGVNDITFIIGGSLGLSKEVIQISDLKLSFSKMTFPHQIMRFILLEQIYRGFKIMKNEPYHK